MAAAAGQSPQAGRLSHGQNSVLLKTAIDNIQIFSTTGKNAMKGWLQPSPAPALLPAALWENSSVGQLPAEHCVQYGTVGNVVWSRFVFV